MIIGLTGGIACGKSAVGSILEDLGAYVIDADQVSQQLYEPGSFLFSRIVEAFGGEVVKSDGSLDRKLLGQKVFASSERRQQLESIVHPAIWSEIVQRLDRQRAQFPNQTVVLMVPLLLENRRQSMVDEVWVVDVSPETQIERLQKRNQLTLEECQQRLAAQMPRNQRLAQADVVIDNNLSLEQTRQQIVRLWSERGL